jgi:hypothetical protein
VPGEHDRDRGPAGLGDRDGGVADGVLRALQAHADLGERAVRVAEAVLHVHHEQRLVCHVPASIARSVGIHGNRGPPGKARVPPRVSIR